MDDFYSSMKDYINLEDNDLELQDNSNKGSSSSMFVEGLTPINPYRWPSFMAGSASASDANDLPGKLGTPFNNIQVAQEYLASAQSDVQYRDRLWKVAEDTVTVNAISEFGGEAGSFAAGAISNKIADKYMNEMVETELSKNLNEELNMEIFRATAIDNKRDPSNVRGTGTIRQNVPEYMQGDIFDRPKRNERPPEWGDSGGLDEEGLGSDPSKPNDSPGGGSSSDSIGQSGALGSDQSTSPDSISDQDNKSDQDDKSDGFFARCFGWLFGGGAGQCGDPTVMCPYEAEKLREEVENDYVGFGGIDITHPAYNPPMFVNDFILPPD